MRTRVGDVLGQVYNSTLLPLWMTSQQPDTAANRAAGVAGGALGYTQAWVICYTKPGYADIVKANIEKNWGYYYSGMFKENKFHGYGIYKWADGRLYLG
jgi:predicted secreted Zn-dependent protease